MTDVYDTGATARGMTLAWRRAMTRAMTIRNWRNL